MFYRMTLVLVAALAFVIGPDVGARQQSNIAQEAPASTWQSATIWQPTLPLSGDALATLMNEIDASCSVDVDPVVVTAGVGPEGPVYAFAVTWACPAVAGASGATWNSAMIWRPSLAEAGEALTGLVNEIDASCTVDVDSVMASGGAGPEGPVYAFVVTWACPAIAGASGVPAIGMTVG